MRKFFLAAVLVLMASGAQAATLNVIDGILHGAFGVDVGGALYDVEFLDGTCIDLFTGCDEQADFTFTDEASATLASEALLDEVFVDGPGGQFRSEPNLTVGCSDSRLCNTLTPIAVNSSGPLAYLAFVGARNCYYSGGTFATPCNNPGGIGNTFGDGRYAWEGSIPVDSDLIGEGAPESTSVYALWSLDPIPEPSTALLVGLGLVGIAARRRPRR